MIITPPIKVKQGRIFIILYATLGFSVGFKMQFELTSVQLME